MSAAHEHPGRLELIQYVRGGVAPGHAAAILAHCLACEPCAAELGVLIQTGGYRPIGLGASIAGRGVLVPGS